VVTNATVTSGENKFNYNSNQQIFLWHCLSVYYIINVNSITVIIKIIILFTLISDYFKYYSNCWYISIFVSVSSDIQWLLRLWNCVYYTDISFLCSYYLFYLFVASAVGLTFFHVVFFFFRCSRSSILCACCSLYYVRLYASFVLHHLHVVCSLFGEWLFLIFWYVSFGHLLLQILNIIILTGGHFMYINRRWLLTRGLLCCMVWMLFYCWLQVIIILRGMI